MEGMGKWRAMLAAAALYNLVIGGAALIAPGASVDGRVAALLVVCFGLVYALVARDPLRLAPVLWAGVLGKLGVIALVWPEVLAGRAAPGTGTILAGDAVFTVLFVVFLLTAARKQP
ncbi:MAG: hypothetical protein ACKOOL_07280 [Novosphingobium sp.]